MVKKKKKKTKAKKKKKKLKKKKKDSKSSVIRLENSENKILSELNIEKSLRAIGKEIFATILYPEILQNINIKHFEISNKHPRFRIFTENSQRTRLSKAKSIFKAGLEIEALINISKSNKLNYKIKEKLSEIIKTYTKV